MREKARDTKMFTHDIPLRLIKVLDIISMHDNTVYMLLVWILCQSDGKQFL